MKIRSKLLIAVLLLTSVAVAPSQAAPALSIGIAYDIGGRGDQSFNDAAAAGLVKAQKEFTFSVESVVTDGSSVDRERRVRSLITKNCNPIIVVGSGYAPTLRLLAIEFPNTQFAILNDATVDALNVTSLVFADLQGAFLAGYSAALVTKTNKVAMIASPNQSELYESGFSIGVAAAKKSVTSIIKYVNGSESLATKQVMAAGADVIFVARLGSSSDAFEAIVGRNLAKQKLKSFKAVGMISIEPDQYISVTSSTKKYLYATVVKRVDKAMYDVISKALSGELLLDVLDPKAGIYGYRYGITGGGISITTYLPALTAASGSINAAAVQALKLTS
jgi:basic membrane protein A